MEIKTLLAQIVKKKHQTKSQLEQLKNKYLVDIYEGLSKNKKVREIHQQILDDTLAQKKKGFAINDEMTKQALKYVSVLKKKVGNSSFVEGYVKTTYGSQVEESSPVELLAIFAFDLIKKVNVEKKLSKSINAQLDKEEGKWKEDDIANNISENRMLKKPKIFYLASEHRDSASDHAPYQGKVYVDEKWRNYVIDNEEIRKVRQYITSKKVQTVQWVMGKPVWFITRPNCRHYFKALDTDEVLQTSKTKLLEKHKMETALGNREYLQTIKHSTNKDWYEEVRNAQILLDKYQERLKLHQDMYASSKNIILRKAIVKDKMLIEKWKKYIDEKQKK